MCLIIGCVGCECNCLCGQTVELCVFAVLLPYACSYKTQAVVLSCDLMSIDLSDVSCTSDMHYSRSDTQQHQGELEKLRCFEVFFKGQRSLPGFRFNII